MENIQVFGDVPSARFGHTATKVSSNKIIIFGGAVGDIGKYSISDETFCFDTQSLVWKRLISEGIGPSPRAAHAATSVEKFQMILYGGASGGGRNLLNFKKKASRITNIFIQNLLYFRRSCSG